MARITTPLAWAALLATILVAVLAVVPTSTAQADTQFTATVLTVEGWDHADLYAAPGTSYAIAGTAAAGFDITLGCWIQGDMTTGPSGYSSRLWYTVVDSKSELGTESYISDTMIWTGTNDPVTDPCGGLPDPETTPPTPAQPSQKYDRQDAVDWALANVNSGHRYEQDCTWFVSQALWAGGMPKTEEWNPDPGFGAIDPPPAARIADDFTTYLTHEMASAYAGIDELSWNQNDVPEAQLGDVIVYDYGNANTPADGIIDHVMIITGFSGRYPLVSGHTNDVSNQGWTYSQTGGNWISQDNPGSRVYLVHIIY